VGFDGTRMSGCVPPRQTPLSRRLSNWRTRLEFRLRPIDAFPFSKSVFSGELHIRGIEGVGPTHLAAAWLTRSLSRLSLKLGRSIRFDPAKEQIAGDKEAVRLAIPKNRAPWKFPEKYLKA